MQLLGLSEDISLGSLPASRFPERASAYFCDKCGEDISGRFYVRKGHGSPPLGPPTFYCGCGERYLSGTREWDQLGANEKRVYLGTLRIATLVAVPFLFSLTAAVLGVRWDNKALTIIGSVLAVITAPFSIMMVPGFLVIGNIMASIFRTRILSRLKR